MNRHTTAGMPPRGTRGVSVWLNTCEQMGKVGGGRSAPPVRNGTTRAGQMVATSILVRKFYCQMMNLLL